MVDSMTSESNSVLPLPSGRKDLGTLDIRVGSDKGVSLMSQTSSKSTTLASGSLGTLSRVMELDHKKEPRKSELSSQARAALRMAYECLAKTHNFVITPELMTVWSSHRKASTVNGYANNFRLWDFYCKSEGIESLPVNAKYLAAWLAAASL